MWLYSHFVYSPSHSKIHLLRWTIIFWARFRWKLIHLHDEIFLFERKMKLKKEEKFETEKKVITFKCCFSLRCISHGFGQSKERKKPALCEMLENDIEKKRVHRNQRNNFFTMRKQVLFDILFFPLCKKFNWIERAQWERKEETWVPYCQVTALEMLFLKSFIVATHSSYKVLLFPSNYEQFF